MPDKHLHIVSFNIPYPPNYGGVIDVFYKLKALHSAGIKIYLHCFVYGRPVNKELYEYCEKIYCYKRKTGFLSAVGLKPYIVSSRRSEDLIRNLLKDDYPILFEGLHSCYYLSDNRLEKCVKIYRESNIEHRYYFNLSVSERNLGKKIYFFIAGMKLKLYQKILKNADLMLVVSESDVKYLSEKFPKNKIVFLPSFHANEMLDVKEGRGKYALYHGNLSVPENEFTARFLIKKVFNDIHIPLKIAGLHPPKRLMRLASSYSNVEIITNPDDDEMKQLVRNAQLNVLVTFQATGLKLKLLNALYNGRFCLVNKKMLAGTGLDGICHVADSAELLKKNVIKLFDTEFDNAELALREEVLNENYSNKKNAAKLIDRIFR